MNPTIEQLIQEWNEKIRETNDEYIHKLVMLTQQSAMQNFMQHVMNAAGLPQTIVKPVLESPAPTTTDAVKEARKAELLARSNRVRPKLTGDVTIHNPKPKPEQTLITDSDPSYGMMGSGCVTEALETPLAVPIDGE